MHDEHIFDDQGQVFFVVSVQKNIFQFSLNHSCLLGVEESRNLEYADFNELHQVPTLFIVFENIEQLDENLSKN